MESYGRDLARLAYFALLFVGINVKRLRRVPSSGGHDAYSRGSNIRLRVTLPSPPRFERHYPRSGNRWTVFLGQKEIIKNPRQTGGDFLSGRGNLLARVWQVFDTQPERSDAYGQYGGEERLVREAIHDQAAHQRSDSEHWGHKGVVDADEAAGLLRRGQLEDHVGVAHALDRIHAAHADGDDVEGQRRGGGEREDAGENEQYAVEDVDHLVAVAVAQPAQQEAHQGLGEQDDHGEDPDRAAVQAETADGVDGKEGIAHQAKVHKAAHQKVALEAQRFTDVLRDGLQEGFEVFRLGLDGERHFAEAGDEERRDERSAKAQPEQVTQVDGEVVAVEQVRSDERGGQADQAAQGAVEAKEQAAVADDVLAGEIAVSRADQPVGHGEDQERDHQDQQRQLITDQPGELRHQGNRQDADALGGRNPEDGPLAGGAAVDQKGADELREEVAQVVDGRHQADIGGVLGEFGDKIRNDRILRQHRHGEGKERRIQRQHQEIPAIVLLHRLDVVGEILFDFLDIGA